MKVHKMILIDSELLVGVQYSRALCRQGYAGLFVEKEWKKVTCRQCASKRKSP